MRVHFATALVNQQAAFRDPHKSLDSFDFSFNKKMNRSSVFDLAGGTFIARHEDALFLGPAGTGKSHLAQGYRPSRDPTGLSRVVSRDSPAASRSLPKPRSMVHAKS